jgi:hypothetical protein
MRKKLGIWIWAAAGLLVIAAAIVTARASAAQEAPARIAHSNKALRGHWGFSSSSGVLLPPASPQPVPAAGIGRIFFDGDGGCSITSVANFGGQVSRLVSSSCKYFVAADGMGRAEAVFPNAPVPDAFPVEFIVVDQGREIRFLNTKFIVGTFTAQRQ